MSILTTNVLWGQSGMWEIDAKRKLGESELLLTSLLNMCYIQLLVEYRIGLDTYAQDKQISAVSKLSTLNLVLR